MTTKRDARNRIAEEEDKVRRLQKALTEALRYFIGPGPMPTVEQIARWQAVAVAILPSEWKRAVSGPFTRLVCRHCGLPVDLHLNAWRHLRGNRPSCGKAPEPVEAPLPEYRVTP